MSWGPRADTADQVSAPGIWVRLVRHSFCSTCSTWPSIVLGDSTSLAAISLLDRPSATRPATSRSRGVSRARVSETAVVWGGGEDRKSVEEGKSGLVCGELDGCRSNK